LCFPVYQVASYRQSYSSKAVAVGVYDDAVADVADGGVAAAAADVVGGDAVVGAAAAAGVDGRTSR